MKQLKRSRVSAKRQQIFFLKLKLFNQKKNGLKKKNEKNQIN